MSKDNTKRIKELEAEIQEYNQASKNEIPKSKSGMNELLQLFMGIILICVGLFMFSQKVIVHTGWLSWSIGGFNLSSGTITIPLLISIIWYFLNPKSIVPKLLMILGVILIIVSVIMSLRINFVASTLFDYVLIFGMMAAGSGLSLRVLFKKH